MPLHYACHWFVIPAVAILEGAQVRMQTMSALGTNFSKLTTSLQHDAWRHTNILAGASILCMPLFCDTCANEECTWNNFLVSKRFQRYHAWRG